MSDKEMRLNMIKLFALGMKCVNDAMENSHTLTDSASDYIDLIFDENNGDPSSIDKILERLDNYKDVNHMDENKRTKHLVNKIYQNNQAIEAVKERIDKLNII